MFMRNSTFVAVLLALIGGSIAGSIKGLALLCIGFGIDKVLQARGHDVDQKKKAVTCLVVGIILIICGVISLTNIV